VLFVAFFFFIEKKTLLGQYAMAIGGNRNAAFFSGINGGMIIFREFDVIPAILLGGPALQVFLSLPV